MTDLKKQVALKKNWGFYGINFNKRHYERTERTNC